MGLLISGSSWFEYCLVLPAFLCLQITAELQVELRVSCGVLPAHRCVEWGVPIAISPSPCPPKGRAQWEEETFGQHEFCVHHPKNRSFCQQALQGKFDTFWYQNCM